jgi:Holliday junction resolvase RusA-like endonuclease
LKKTILAITPQTHVRATQGDKVFFRIPREQLRPAGLKRLLRLERYNQYKVDLLAEAKRNRFVFPPEGAALTFFIPVPRSWSKKKKRAHHGKLHQAKPDLDNLLKAMLDALIVEDKYICHYGELAKRWVDFEEGWIEVRQIPPSEVLIEPPPKGVVGVCEY